MKLICQLIPILLLTITRSCAFELRIGVIYDGGLDVRYFNLSRELDLIRPTLQYYSVTNLGHSKFQQAPTLNIITRKFNINELCDLVSSGVRLIISLTSCGVAKYLEYSTAEMQIPHVAIPRPECGPSDFVSRDSTIVGPTTTVWIQTDRSVLAEALYEVLVDSHLSHNLVLVNGRNPLSRELHAQVFSTMMKPDRFVPEFSFQAYKPFGWEKDFSDHLNAHHTFPEMISALWNATGRRQRKSLFSHVVLIAQQPIIMDELEEIFRQFTITRKYFWILGEKLEITTVDLLAGTMRLANDNMKIGFFRQFPILSPEDCQDVNSDDSLRILSENAFDCDYTDKPERFIIAAYAIMFGSQTTVMNGLSESQINSEQSFLCTHNQTSHYSYGQQFYETLKKLVEEQSWDDLHFYSLETLPDDTERYMKTAKYNINTKLTLTEHGQKVAQESLTPGHFANVFRSLENRTLNVGILLEEPYILESTVHPSGEVFNATGLAIDILNELAIRFAFRYRLFVPRDGYFGTLQPSGKWSGLVGDLLEGKIELIAAPLTITDERNEYVRFIGSFMEDTMSILINRPKENDELFQMLKPFTTNIWMFSIAAVFIAAFVFFIITSLSPYSAWTRRIIGSRDGETSIYEQLWFSIGSSMLQGQYFRGYSCSARAVCLPFWFLVFLFHTVWQADLTAYLARKYLALPIRNLKDLSESQEIIPITITQSAHFEIFRDAVDNPIYDVIYRKLLQYNVSVESTDYGVDLVRNFSQYAFIKDRAPLVYAAEQDCNELYLLEDKFDIVQVGFAVPYDSLYGDAMSEYMEDLKENGVIDRLLRERNFFGQPCMTSAAAYSVLPLQTAGGAFIILLGFIGISLLTLACEVAWKIFVTRRLSQAQWIHRFSLPDNIPIRNNMDPQPSDTQNISIADVAEHDNIESNVVRKRKRPSLKNIP